MVRAARACLVTALLLVALPAAPAGAQEAPDTCRFGPSQLARGLRGARDPEPRAPARRRAVPGRVAGRVHLGLPAREEPEPRVAAVGDREAREHPRVRPGGRPVLGPARAARRRGGPLTAAGRAVRRAGTAGSDTRPTRTGSTRTSSTRDWTTASARRSASRTSTCGAPSGSSARSWPRARGTCSSHRCCGAADGCAGRRRSCVRSSTTTITCTCGCGRSDRARAPGRGGRRRARNGTRASP